MWPPNRIRITLLTVGAVAGLSLAAPDLLDFKPSSYRPLPPTVIARVGNQHIPASRYLELMADLEADKRAPLDEKDREFVISRLIDEELLIQRGIELGYEVSSPQVRKTLAAAVIAQVAAEHSAELPNEAELLNFYQSEADFFSIKGRYRVRWWRFPGSLEDSMQVAALARSQLEQGALIEDIIAATGVEAQEFLPNQLMPLTKLADYLGPELAQAIPELQAGTYSSPIVAGGSTHILLVEESQSAQVPEFDSIRPQVEAEYLRRSGDRALRSYLEWLRQRSEIVVASGRPD